MKKIISIFLAGVMACMMAVVPVNAVTLTKADGEDFSSYATYSGTDLGATYTKAATTFKVWAPTADKVSVNLYTTGTDKEEGAEKLLTQAMTLDASTGVWSTTVDGDKCNIYYTYTVEINGAVNEVVDIYAKAAGANGNRGMIADLDSTNPDNWANDKRVTVAQQSDAIIWELQIKDFSYDKSSGVSDANRGKYLAFTEITSLYNQGGTATCVEYLKNLGITHVQINPFYDFATIDETGDDSQYNWGYDPKNYNVPEGSFSSNPYDGNVRINECKQMIQALHNAGIGVIMDVVYNHTYTGIDSWFNLTVPNYYYRIKADGTWSNGSGCGNDTASERYMYSQFMINSVAYWAKEYHIDGFRFDLMGLQDVDTMNAIRDELDKIDSKLLMYGEAWSHSTSYDTTNWKGNLTRLATQDNFKHMSSRIAAFNDGIRDAIKGGVFNSADKGFAQGNANSASKLVSNIKGPTWAGAPTQFVSFSSCHDNNTLYDRIIESVYSTSSDAYFKRYDDLVDMNKIAAASLLTSQGISFMLAGEELARTKFGDENSYKSSPEINKIDWTRVEEYGDLSAYYAGLIEIRKAYSAFTDGTGAGANTLRFTKTTEDAPKGVVAFTMDNNVAGEWKTLAVVMNNTEESQTVELKSDTVTLPTSWVVVANGEEAGVTKLNEVSGTSVTIGARSCLVLVDKSSFESANINAEHGKVHVNHIDKDSKEIIASYVISGKLGAAYVTNKAASLELCYDFVNADSNTTGTFTESAQTVNYYYTKYVPRIEDISGDSKVSMLDVTLLQRVIASLDTLDSDTYAKANIDGDDKVSMSDVVMMQQFIAGLQVGIGTVTTRFVTVDSDGEKEISDSIVTTARMGEKYETSAASVSYYKLDESKLPANATGTYANGNTIVTYYYIFDALKREIHVKHNGGGTWTPHLYVWEGTSTEMAPWPGVEMTDADGDGWFDYTIEVGGEFNFIVNDNGASQTADFTGYDSDLWIYINVSSLSKSLSDLTVYTSKP